MGFGTLPYGKPGLEPGSAPCNASSLLAVLPVREALFFFNRQTYTHKGIFVYYLGLGRFHKGFSEKFPRTPLSLGFPWPNGEILKDLFLPLGTNQPKN